MPIFKFDKIQSIEPFPLMKSTANEHYVLTLPYISNFEGKSKGCRFFFFFLSLCLSSFFYIYWIEKKLSWVKEIKAKENDENWNKVKIDSLKSLKSPKSAFINSNHF